MISYKEILKQRKIKIKMSEGSIMCLDLNRVVLSILGNSLVELKIINYRDIDFHVVDKLVEAGDSGVLVLISQWRWSISSRIHNMKKNK